MRRRVTLIGSMLMVLSVVVRAQVTSERLLRAAEEPQNWITYSGGYASQRHSLLTQITPANVKNLELKWILPNQVFGAWQSSPIVVDGIMYVTQRPNDVLAVDAKTGRVFWQYRYNVSPDARVCCGANNRGVAILGDTLYTGTLDGHLVALDKTTGRSLWDVAVGDPKQGYSITMAPLIVKDKVLVGSGGGEYGIRGFIAAFDAKSGNELWRFHTIPGPGEKGHDTWSGDSWKSGGASVWVTPSYDPVLNLTYWGVGNPGPDFNPAQRMGDNLYTDSVVALNPDTGELKWHFQFSPHDPYDYDSVQVGVLADINWKGTPTKALLWGNRNGFFYVLDRTNGRFLSGTPFVKSTGRAASMKRESRFPLHSQKGNRPGPASRAAPTGTRRRSARERVCSISPCGTATRRSSSRNPHSTYRGATFSAAARRRMRACRGRPAYALAGRRRSTPGPMRPAAVASSPSIRRPDRRNGRSSSSMSPTAETSRRRPTCCSPAGARGTSMRSMLAQEPSCGRRAWAARSPTVPSATQLMGSSTSP